MMAARRLGGGNAVLAGDDHGLGPQCPGNRPRRAFDIVILDHEEDDIGRGGLGDIADRANIGQVQIAFRTVRDQPVFLQRRQMRPPRDQLDRMARRRQPRAEIATDGPRPHHHDLQCPSPPVAPTKPVARSFPPIRAEIQKNPGPGKFPLAAPRAPD